jgi:hypothetical protein
MSIDSKKNFINHLFDGHFFPLLVCLLMFLISYPYLWDWNWGQKILIVLLLAILFAGVISMREIKWVFYTGMLLGSPVFILYLIRIFRQETPFMEFLTLLFIIPFFAYVTLTALYRVLSGDEVTLDKLFGAAAVYLLMGLTWSVAYSVIEQIRPGNFFVPLIGTSEAMPRDPSHYPSGPVAVHPRSGFGSIVRCFPRGQAGEYVSER